MAQCAACGVQIAANSRFCSSCGTPVDADVAATRTVSSASHPETPKSDRRSPRPRTSSSTSTSDDRFPPGTLLAGRYRIVSLLGRGGMGEVYRADDLTLGQAVALKFLPEAVARNEQALARFRNEVRVARQVSHANVCRVYDVGEIDGQVFLSMEYVDGEDLASLLRRIGRLPGDKALEIARKLCAGLAAAHEKGVLHRDLKPSNVMLDGRGQVLLTDFGLAGLADEIEGTDIRNGTPAYMAPEQLSGQEVTTRSDIYSLGLVLYEVFTGKRPFEAATLAELVRVRTDTTPTSLTTLVKDLDPAVERVILRCLEPEPARRPSSAMGVAAALPGGDPLAAALAAGEVPSPQMVAAAGEGSGLTPRIAISLLAVTLAALLAFAFFQSRRGALEQIHHPYSPEVLAQKARDLIQSLGYNQPAADDAYGFDWDAPLADYIRNNEGSRWPQSLAQRPSLLSFWYRSSPYPLDAVQFHDDLLTPGMVQLDDPAPVQSGMTTVRLDAEGRLQYFESIPPEVQPPGQVSSTVDWKPLFAAAGLNPALLHSAERVWNWLAASDSRAAWDGNWPGSARPLHVEAASLRGRPVAFRLVGPWTKPDRMPPVQALGRDQVQAAILIGIVFVVMISGTLLLRGSQKRKIADAEGATRLGFWIACVLMALWLSRSHWGDAIGTFGSFLVAIATAVAYGFVVRMMYIALEPYVRRRWPQTIISWTAMVRGRVREPVVGRDVLIGIAAQAILFVVFRLVDMAVVGSGDEPRLGELAGLLGIRASAGLFFGSLLHGIREALLVFFLLFVLRALLRNQWAAMLGVAAIFTALAVPGSAHPVLQGVQQMLAICVIVSVVLRFGLLALAATVFTGSILDNLQPTLNFTSWYAWNTVFVLMLVAGLAIWACYTSLGGQQVWKQDWLES